MDVNYSFLGTKTETKTYYIFICHKCKTKFASSSYEFGEKILNDCAFCREKEREEVLKLAIKNKKK